MNRKLITILIIFLAAAAGFFVISRHFTAQNTEQKTGAAKDVYYCPMHPNVTSDKQGECPICHMSLVKRGSASQMSGGQKEKSGERKILYYRNPMNPQVTSPVPMKDEMGMDYVPVYEDQNIPADIQGVYISPEKQQLIGVQKGKVERRELSGEILTVGRVAYDSALYTAQQEYIQSLKSSKSLKTGNSNYIQEQSSELIKSMKQKLMAMGMSEPEIAELEKQGKPQQNLYLPTSEDKNVWVYVTIYEYEAGLVQTGTQVEIKPIAYPGEIFKGNVVTVTPILEAATRTLKVRTLVENPENKLKLEMFVNVAIKYNIGERLAVPEEAILHAGTRDIVFIAEADGYFEPRIVTLGQKAHGYYAVLKGLSENEMVVTSGNFLIDSESKLNSALNQMTEPNKAPATHTGH